MTSTSASVFGSLSAATWNGIALAGVLLLAGGGGSLVLGQIKQARADTGAAEEAQRLIGRATPEGIAQVQTRTARLKATDTKASPQPSKPSDIVRAFHSAALAMHVDLISIRPVPDPSSVAAWTLHLEFAGAYDDIGFFLSLVEQAPLSTQVRLLRLEPRAGGRAGTPRVLLGTAETYVTLVQRPAAP